MMKRVVASMHTPDPKFRYMIDHPHQMNFFVTRLRFTVQSEEAWLLTKEDISSIQASPRQMASSSSMTRRTQRLTTA